MYYRQSQTAIHVASASLDSCLQSPTATQQHQFVSVLSYLIIMSLWARHRYRHRYSFSDDSIDNVKYLWL